MPYYYFTEIWTPLTFIGIKLFRDDEGRLWAKVWGFDRRPFKSYFKSNRSSENTKS
jgi:hypothetical protein